MIHISETIDIDRPVADVFAFVTDASRIPEWRKDILVTTGPQHVAVGTEFVETINFMGKKPFTMKVLEIVPNRREVIENTAGPGVRPVQTFDFESKGEGTRLTVSVAIRTHGFFRLMEPMLPSMIRKNWKGYLTTLKSQLEST